MHFSWLFLNKLESIAIPAKYITKTQNGRQCILPIFILLNSLFNFVSNEVTFKTHTKHTHLFFRSALFCSQFVVWQLTAT